MSTDSLVASLPALRFGEPPAITWERFEAELSSAINAGGSTPKAGGATPGDAADGYLPEEWRDLETQLRNAMAEARGGGERFRHAANGCSLYWKNRVLACFQEKDVLKRDEMLDRVWWDAAGELTPPASPLGKGALATYAVRLKIALKRAKISSAAGNAAFDRLTAETRIEAGGEK